MRPTFHMLTTQLSKTWKLSCSDPSQANLPLQPPLLYDSEMRLQSDQVYIVHATQEISTQADEVQGIFVCCCETGIHEQNSIAPGTIMIQSAVSVATVLNRVQAIFVMYQQWVDTLRQIVSDGNRSLQELLDVSSPVLGHLLTVSDENIHILASSNEGQRVSDDHSILGVFSDDNTLDGLKMATRRVSGNRYAFDPQHARHIGSSSELHYIHITDGQIHLGILSMQPVGQPLQEHDVQLLELLSDYVKTMLLRPSQTGGKFFGNVLQSLLDGLPVPEKHLERLTEALDTQPGDQFRCIVIQLPQQSLTNLSRYIRNRFQMEIPASIAIVHDQQIVGLINDTRFARKDRDFYDWVHRWLLNMDCLAGASDSFAELVKVNDYYAEAKAVIHFVNPEVSRVRTFADCWQEYVLHHCVGELPPSLLFPPGLVRLLDYDEQSAVDYVETLRIWLEEGRNDSRTASRLFISRNSFLSRKERLVSLLGSDLSDVDERFRVELCLRLLK